VPARIRLSSSFGRRAIKKAKEHSRKQLLFASISFARRVYTNVKTKSKKIVV